jgi:ectoine hydroxylase-related dioxygenase (phytanoyl-CoA dioxygenase family)
MTAVAVSPTPPIAADLSLRPEQVAAFHRDGFLRIERIIPDADVAMIRATLERLFRERRGRESGDQFDLGGADEEGKPAGLPQILGPSRFASELTATRFQANGMAVARQLLASTPAAAEQVRWGGDHTILKPARYGLATPWHQDEAYWDPWTDHHGISIWLALQDATVANGTLWFVPGSHRFEILPHRPISDDPRIHGLELVDAAIGAQGVAQPVAAGGCLIHYCRTLHHAGPNTTDQDRHAYICGFSSPGTRRAERRHVPWQDRQRTPRSARAAAAQAAEASRAQAAGRPTTVGT